MTTSPTYNTATIRELLNRGFTSDEISDLSYDYFPEVFNNFSTGMSKGQKIQHLLEHCVRRELIPQLLDAIQRERPEKYEPYRLRVEPTEQVANDSGIDDNDSANSSDQGSQTFAGARPIFGERGTGKSALGLGTVVIGDLNVAGPNENKVSRTADEKQIDATLSSTSSAEILDPQIKEASLDAVTLSSDVKDKPSKEPEPEAQVSVQKLERFEIPPRGLADTTSEANDLLKFSDYVQALLPDFIQDKQTGKPLTIGIDAAWGMGKTTLMRMLMNKLNGEAVRQQQKQAATSSEASQTAVLPSSKALLTVWFDAWTYDQEESLWAALVLEILTQIRRQFRWWQRIGLWLDLNWKRSDRGGLLRDLTKSALKLAAYIIGVFIIMSVVTIVASWLLGSQPQISVDKLSDYLKLLVSVGLVGFIPVLYTIIKDLLKGIVKPFDLNVAKYVREPDYRERIGFLAQFKRDYDCVIGSVAKDPARPLVIFIDDLDRCAPTRSAEIIEAINLLLDAKNCVFVLGMDAKMVAASLEAKYKDLKAYIEDDSERGGSNSGQRFLEKIIQVNFHIPRSEPQQIDWFIDVNLGAKVEESVPEPSQSEIAKLQRRLEAGERVEPESARDKAVAARAKQEIFIKSFNDSDEVKNAIHEAKQYLGLNPRKIKRFINSFRLQALIANRRGLLEAKQIRLKLLGKWLVIVMRWPDVVGLMTTDHSFIDRLKQAREAQRVTKKTNLSKKAKTDLDALLADPQIKRVLELPDFVGLLDSVSSTEVETLHYYLHLALITQPTTIVSESETAPKGA